MMSFRHDFALSQLQNNKLQIDFPGPTNSYSYSSREKNNRSAISALHTILVYLLKMEEKTDFEVGKNQNYTDAKEHFIINRDANIILVLNFLLNEGKKTFKISESCHSDRYSEYEEKKWRINFGKLLTECIGSKDLKVGEVERLRPLMLAHLNAQYELLKQEALVIEMKEKAVEHVGEDLLKHPFYQTLCLLMEDFQTRETLYKSKGFFDKWVVSKPDPEKYKQVYSKFINFVPVCYCDEKTIYRSYSNEIEKILNADKLKQSKVVIQENNINNNSNNVIEIPKTNSNYMKK